MLDVKEVVFPTPVKAMLASFLVDEWQDSDVEKQALRMAVGLDPPDEEFWKPIGAATSSLSPRDKINLLAHVISFIGSADKQKDFIHDLPSFLITTEDLLKSKFESLSDADAQLLATEFLICEYLTSSTSLTATKTRISMYISDILFSQSYRVLLEQLKSRWETVSFN